MIDENIQPFLAQNSKFMDYNQFQNNLRERSFSENHRSFQPLQLVSYSVHHGNMMIGVLVLQKYQING